MKIPSELAQSIVDRAIRILGKNVNIMDDTAQVIGSGDPSRIGEYHYAAAVAIAENRTVEVDKENMEELRCKRTGINVPVVLGDDIVGVVGMTGEPDEVRGYGELLKEFVELMLQQALLTEESQLKREACAHFVADLIAENPEEEESILVVRAGLLGFRFGIRRVAVVISLHRGDGRGYPFIGELGTGREELETQKLRNNIMELMRTNFATCEQDMLTFTSGDQVVVLKSVACGPGEENWASQLRESCGELQERLSAIVGGITIGIGRPVTSPSGIRASYAEAFSACHAGKRLWGPGRIYFVDDLGVAELIREIPAGTRRRFVERIIGRLLESDSERLLTTLDTYFKCDCDLKRTSANLFIHRNTLVYRLKKICQLTGFEPRRFSDAMQLQMALMLSEYDHSSSMFDN